MVIFTTAYPEFATESYEYNATDYLVKPIRYERFLKAVNKASGKASATMLHNSGNANEDAYNQGKARGSRNSMLNATK